MAAVDPVRLVDEGLGNSAYLVDLGAGRGLVVDVGLDLRAARKAADRRGLRLAFAADTHLHADFVSGARQLAATDGAQILASAAGHREFAHTGLRDRDEVDLGGLRLRAMATPGHTDEHLSFLLLDGDRPVGVFTGGSLLVGSAARTDLVDPNRTEALARRQYASLRRLAELPDEVAVWPTHGAGSFCSASSGAERTSTIGREKATNALLRMDDEDAFVTTLVESLGSFPPYFLTLGEINRRGPEVVKGDSLPGLATGEVVRLRETGAEIVDVRPVPDFAAAHVPGSVSIPLRPVFATWLGWLLSAGKPVVIVRNADQEPAEILWQARKIGYERLIGELDGGISAWAGGGHPTGSIPLVSAEHVGGASVLDIRQTNEFTAGHIPGAAHVELGDLANEPASPGTDLNGPTVVMCGHGERAMGAASLLARAGQREISVLVGGPDDWAAISGRSLEAGS
jgi:glyoxylase-like metal-dependent hydrolase (beta-lactamase superfamily II)/rhodanese-related sulfurtransferase